MTGTGAVGVLATFEGLHLASVRPLAVYEQLVKAFVTMPILWIVLTLRASNVLSPAERPGDRRDAAWPAERWCLVGIGLAALFGATVATSDPDERWLTWLPLRVGTVIFCVLQRSAIQRWLMHGAPSDAARRIALTMLLLAAGLSIVATLFPIT